MNQRKGIGIIMFIALSGLFPHTGSAQQIAFPTGDLVFKGDLRYRHEQISQEGTNQRDRQRIRARMSVTATVDPKVNFIFGVASGNSNDPISSNQDLGAGFSDKPLWIDQAYFDWTTPITGLKLQGGKMKNPFLAVGRNQMIWDHDLNMEGFAAQFSKKTGPTEFFANGSLFWVEERASADDSFLLGGQAGIKHSLDLIDLTAGVGLYEYTNAKGSATFYDAGKGFGNSVDTNNKYLYDYQNIEVFGEFAVSRDFPVSLIGDYITNTASEVKDKNAYLVGLSIGKTSMPGSCVARIHYRSVERDAVIAAFNDSDFADGGTDNRGFVFQYDYQASKNVTLGATFFVNQKGIKNGINYNRLQIDSNFKF